MKHDVGKMAFGDILSLAEKHGWEDPDYKTDGEWTPEDADATEENAIEFLESKGLVKEEI